MDDLKNYYENYDENNRLLTRHGQVEFLTTMHYISKYLQPNSKILEIGTGTGRYAHALARQGYEVDAIELVEHNIEIFRQNTEANGKVTITQGDARNLQGFVDNKYDITLLLGPMYHIADDSDKLKALSEAIRVTKPGGIVFVAYVMADPAILDHGFIKGNIHELLATGLLDPVTFETEYNLFELLRKKDIDKLMTNFATTRLNYVAADGYAPHMREAMAGWDDDTFEVFMRYHLATCERVELSGVSHHVLDIFRKG